MTRAKRLLQLIHETLGDLGPIPEPKFAYVHVQSDTAKRLGMARADRVKKRRRNKRKSK